MIRIERGDPPEAFLELASVTRELCEAFDRGDRDFEFDSKLYGRAKPRLSAVQHGKCAFCEAKILHTQPGDVEHFRPKKAWSEAAGKPMQRPGYYWLAYEWTNLVLSCEECNRRGKKNLFPLADEAKRARSHHARLEDEAPLFVDPAAEEPSEHLGFRQEVVFPRTERGSITRDTLDLNRETLQEHRREHLETIRMLREAALVLGKDPLVEALYEKLHSASQPDAEYSAMVRAFLGAEPYSSWGLGITSSSEQ
jgi:uncharacterized protein (TIGR02646 family)